MKRALLSIGFLFTLCVSSLHAQLFCSIFGGVGSDNAYDVLAIADSGFVVAGSTNTYGAGGNDFYVLKYNKSGSIQWTKTIGDFGNEVAYGISVATNGDYIIAGETNSLGNGGDVYVARLTSAGNLLWTRSVGGNGSDYSREITSTTDNGCAVIATTGSYGHGGDDAYVIKLDSNGVVQWNIAIGDVNTDGGQGILASSDGNIVVAGRCFPATGGAQLLVTKLDYSGTILFSNYYSSHDAFDFFVASDIVETNGDYVISGYCDTSGGSNKNSFLTSITTAGVHNWTRIIGIAGNDNGYGMEKTSDGGRTYDEPEA
ncbi:MAG: hypothetical protein IAF38_06115, partial [Bacteroidia bacterium]|nr:hypothetical protein [Bacteroidia bacterium]